MVWVHSGLRVLWIRSVLPTSFHWRLPRDLTYKIQSGSTERANRSRCTKFLKKYSKYQNQSIGSKKQKKISNGFSLGVSTDFQYLRPDKNLWYMSTFGNIFIWIHSRMDRILMDLPIVKFIPWDLKLCKRIFSVLATFQWIVPVITWELDLLLGVMNNEQKRKYRRYGSKGHFSQTLFSHWVQTQQFS